MRKGKLDPTDVVVDDRENWRAVLEDLENVITLSFYTKPSGIPIQGDIDDALELIYNYEDKINSYGVAALSDDGFCGIYLDDLPKENWQALKPQIIEFLTAFYDENKAEFRKQVDRTLEDYDTL